MTKKYFEGCMKNMESFPLEAVKEAMANKEEAVPELLDILDYTIKNVDTVADDEGYLIHIIAIYLLAFFREPEAGKRIAAMAAFSEENVTAFLGDMLGQGFDCIIASVYGGDTGYIKQIIENPEGDEFTKGDAVKAMVVLLKYDRIQRSEVVDYFRELFQGKLERVENTIWDMLVSCSQDIHPGELIDEIRRALDDNLVDPFFSNPAKLEMQMSKSVDEAMNELKNNGYYGLISEEDVISLPKWISFNPHEEDEFVKKEMDISTAGFEFVDWIDENEGESTLSHKKPYHRENFVGRNDPCPCGSGKKYKKCCAN